MTRPRLQGSTYCTRNVMLTCMLHQSEYNPNVLAYVIESRNDIVKQLVPLKDVFRKHKLCQTVFYYEPFLLPIWAKKIIFEMDITKLNAKIGIKPKIEESSRSIQLMCPQASLFQKEDVFHQWKEVLQCPEFHKNIRYDYE